MLTVILLYCLCSFIGAVDVKVSHKKEKGSSSCFSIEEHILVAVLAGPFFILYRAMSVMTEKVADNLVGTKNGTKNGTKKK